MSVLPSVSAAVPLAGPDPWTALRRYTDARIALGRAGGSVRTATLLDFRLAHARARDAVRAPFDASAFAAGLACAFGRAGLRATVRLLATAATDRDTYLVRPDLGRRLSAASRAALADAVAVADLPPPDLVIVVSDGLSTTALAHAVPTLVPLVAGLVADGWSLAPVYVVPFGRVKLQDEIGELLGARISLMLLGERPGLDSPDSLGAYFTYHPRAACRDADRNCVSNIRPAGLAPAAAARTLARLLALCRTRAVSGVALKDTGPSPLKDTAVPRMVE